MSIEAQVCGDKVTLSVSDFLTMIRHARYDRVKDMEEVEPFIADDGTETEVTTRWISLIVREENMRK
jgi:hypothetical protein